MVALGEEAEESLAKAHLAIGLCYSLQASDGKSVSFHYRALHSLKSVYSLPVCLALCAPIFLKLNVMFDLVPHMLQ